MTKALPRYREFQPTELLELWQQGNDTYAIATRLCAPEHEIERRLHAALDARRREAEWGAS